jgi:hypothetical protein
MGKWEDLAHSLYAKCRWHEVLMSLLLFFLSFFFCSHRISKESRRYVSKNTNGTMDASFVDF